MKVVFSKNDLIGSYVIRLLSNDHARLGDTPSHMALIFWDSLVIESVIGDGVRLNFYPTFLKKNKIVAEFEMINSDSKSNYNLVASKFHGRKYDYLGVLWFALQIILHKVFKVKLKKNPFSSNTALFCNEVIEPLLGYSVSSMTPYQLLKHLSGHSSFVRLK